ncbi:MAG: hypothetical protein SPC25_00410 [Atopobiaceae bacterium]|nr:hypothetical protein [Atopobiaceae bacterium]
MSKLTSTTIAIVACGLVVPLLPDGWVASVIVGACLACAAVPYVHSYLLW